MLELNQLEIDLIFAIINPNKKKLNSLKLQLPSLKVKKREFTGVGIFVNFLIEDEKIIDKNLGDFVLSIPGLLKIDKLSNPISFELNITAGAIDFLELVTNGNESWDGNYATYEILSD